MTDIAQVTIEVDSSQLRQAATDTDHLKRATGAAAAQGARLGSQARQVAGGLRAQGAAAKQVGNQARFAGAHVGNLTAQFNDIGVMLAAGQSPLLLAVQQGTQITQVLQNMGSKVGVLQALRLAFVNFISPVQIVTLGIIAGGAALIQWGIRAARAGNETNNFKSHVEALNDILSEHLSITDQSVSSMDKLEETYGSLAASIRPYLEMERELTALLSRRSAQDFSRIFTKEMGESTLGILNPFTDRAREVFEVELGDKMLQQIGHLNRELADTTGTAERVALLQKMSTMTKDLAESSGDINKQEAELIQMLLEQLRIESKILGASERVIEVDDKRAKEIRKMQEWAAKQLADMEAQAQEAEVIAEFGAESARHIAWQVEEGRNALELEIARKGVNEELSRALLDQYDTMVKQQQRARLSERDRKKAHDELQETESIVGDIAGAWGNFVAEGLSDFKGFAEDVKRVFQQLLAEMVAMAAKNRILISLGLGGGAGSAFASGAGGLLGQWGTSALGSAAGGAVGGGLLGGVAQQGASYLAGASGLTAGLGYGLLGTGSSLLGGAGASLVSGFGSYGSLGGFLNVGANAAIAGGGLMATVGAAIPVIGAVLGAASLIDKFTGGAIFGGKTRQRDTGVEIATDGEQLNARNFANFKRSGGLFSSTKRWTEYSALPPEALQGLRDMHSAMYDSVTGMAEVFGGVGEEVEGMTTKVKLNFKGLTDDERTEKLAEFFGNLQSEMAKAALETAGFTTTLEDAVQTLQNVSTTVSTVNQALMSIGADAFAATPTGAQHAMDLANRFGGAGNFAAATGQYVSSLFSQQEQVGMARDNVGRVFGSLGLNTPTSAAGFRNIVNSQDLTTDSGQQAYATLLQIAPVFGQIIDYEKQLAEERKRAAEALRQQIEAMQKQQQSFRYNETLFSSDEIMANLREDLGQYVNYSKEQFRSLILGIDVTTESGREFFTTINDLAPKFIQLTQMEENLADERRRAADEAAAAAEAERQRIEALQQRQNQINFNSAFFDRDELISNLRSELGSRADFSTTQFREELLGIDVTTQAGEQLFETLSNLAPLFIQLTNLEQQLADERQRAIEQETQARERAMDQLLRFTFSSDFYLPREIEANVQRNLLDVFNDLNLAMPSTREEFRALVEGADLTTESGRELFDTLIGIADQFVRVTDDVRGLNDELQGTQALFTTFAQSVFALNTNPQPGAVLSAGDPAVQALIHAINQGNIRVIRELVDLRTETARSSYNPTQQVVDIST